MFIYLPERDVHINLDHVAGIFHTSQGANEELCTMVYLKGDPEPLVVDDPGERETIRKWANLSTVNKSDLKEAP